MNESCQELLLVFDRKHQTCTSYVGVPWVPLCEDISAAQRAATAAADVQGLCPVGADQIRLSSVGPHAVLVFCWGGERGLLEGFLSENPLTAVELAVVAAALAAVPGWEVAWPLRPTLLPSGGAEPAPFTTYTLLPPVACPARHPLMCWHWGTASTVARRSAVLPSGRSAARCAGLIGERRWHRWSSRGISARSACRCSRTGSASRAKEANRQQMRRAREKWARRHVERR